MGVHIYFFDIFNKLIRTYKQENGKDVLIKYHGEEGCHANDSDDFWNWWKDMASYKKSSDKAGFFIIGDNIENVKELSNFKGVTLDPVNSIDMEKSINFINKKHNYHNGNITFIYKDREVLARENTASRKIGESHYSNIYVTTYPQINYEEIVFEENCKKYEVDNPLREYSLSKQNNSLRYTNLNSRLT